MTKLFQTEVSHENFQDTDNTIGNEDMANILSASQDIADIENEARSIDAVTASSEELISNLQTEVDVESRILDSDTSKLSGNIVVLANLSLTNAYDALGVSDFERIGAISHESANASPVTALKVSHEEKQSLIKRAIDLVRKLFKKFGLLLKKLRVKAVLLTENVSKAAKGLAITIAEKNSDYSSTINLDEKKHTKLASKLVLNTISGEKKLTIDSYKELVKVSTESMDAVEKVFTTYNEKFNEINSGSDKYTSKDANAVMSDFVTAIEVTELNLDDANTLGTSLVRTTANSTKIVTITKPKMFKDGIEVTKAQLISRLNSMEPHISENAHKKDSINIKSVPTKYTLSDLVKLLETIGVFSKNAKKVVEANLKVTDKIEKAVESLKDTEGAQGVVKFAGIAGTKAALEATLWYVNINKSTLNAVSYIWGQKVATKK